MVLVWFPHGILGIAWCREHTLAETDFQMFFAENLPTQLRLMKIDAHNGSLYKNAFSAKYVLVLYGKSRRGCAS